MDSLYGEISDALASKLRDIKLLICDIDGVFSDGRIYLGNDGEELKAFHTRDGFGVKALISSGVEVAVITGRNSNIVQQRMTALNIRFIYQGIEDKLQAFDELLAIMKIAKENIAYIGDDVPDISVMEKSGLALCVADAHPLVIKKSDYVTTNKGGFGAVREACDLILQSQNNLEKASGSSI